MYFWDCKGKEIWQLITNKDYKFVIYSKSSAISPISRSITTF